MTVAQTSPVTVSFVGAEPIAGAQTSPVVLSFKDATYFPPRNGFTASWTESVPYTLPTVPLDVGWGAVATGDALAYVAARSPLGAGLVLADFTSPEAFAHVAAASPLGVAGVLARPVTTTAAQVASPLGLAGALARAVGVARASAGSPLGAAAVRATVLRYELRGEVRDGGVLVARRVRAYRRSDGALVSQADTVAGRFALHAGFAPDEFCVVPFDLAEGAVDFTPPAANRVVSVLAEDQP